MICHQCGKNLPEDSQFCPYCGVAQSVQPPEPVQPVQAIPPVQPVQVSQSPPTVQPVQPPQVIPPVRPVQASQPVPPVQTGPVLNGAAFSGVPQFVPGVSVLKKNRKVIVAVFLTVAVVACTVFVLFLWNLPERKFASAMKEDQYEVAGQFIDEIQNPTRRDEAVSRYMRVARIAIQDYCDGDITYEEAKDLIDRLSDGWPGEEMQEKWEELQAVRSDVKYVEQGEDCEAKGDYIGAVACYLQIGEDSPAYGRISQKWDDLREPYILQLLEEAQALADQGKYEEATDLLRSSDELLVYDERVDEKLEEYENAAIGLSADGKFLTMEDYLASDVMKYWIKRMQENFAEAEIGMSVEVEGKGNRLIYTIIIDYEDLLGDMDIDYFSRLLEEELDSQKSTYISLVNDFKLYVAVEDPVAEIRYVTSDGRVICSREFRAD